MKNRMHIFIVWTLAWLSVASLATTAADYQAIDQFIKQQIQDDNIPAVSLSVISLNQTPHQFYSGEGIDEHSQFPLGSLSKSITAIAIMQLVEQGKIELERSIDHYLPAALLPKQASTQQTYPSVAQLLNHTSGFTTAQGLNAWHRPLISLDQRSLELMATGPQTPPQQQFQYSNSNYTLLSKIVEHMSQQAFTDYVDQHIFTPLNMHNSHANINAARNLTPGHNYFLAQPFETHIKQSHWRAGEATMVSSAADFSKFLHWQLNPQSQPKILSAQSLLALRNSVSALKNYNAGWFSNHDQSLFWHLGSVENSQSFMMIMPNQKMAFVVFINGIDYVFGAEKASLGWNIGNLLLNWPTHTEDNNIAQIVLVSACLILMLQCFALWLSVKTHRKGLKTALFLGNALLCWAIPASLLQQFHISLSFARIILPDLGWLLSLNCLMAAIITAILLIRGFGNLIKYKAMF